MRQSLGRWTAARLSPLWDVASRFRADRRGGTAVTAMVMLVPMLFAFGAGVQLMEAVTIRKSLHTGTYEAARYLMLYPPQSIIQSDWEAIARRFIKAELANNPFTDKQLLNLDGPNGLDIKITMEGNRCLDKFELRAEFPIWAPVNIGSQALPFNEWIRLVDVRYSEVVCD